MSILVLFDKHERLECAVKTRGSVHDEAMVLGDGKEFAICAKLCSYDNAFEVKLGDGKVAFQVENETIASFIDSNKHDSIGGE